VLIAGYRVLIQPSTRRIFADDEYKQAGAVLTDDLSPACVILGVKQVPVENLLPDR
jgi:alpha-aminoadipic semialdehyde synthase